MRATTIGTKPTSYFGFGTGSHAQNRQSDHSRLGQAGFNFLVRHARNVGFTFFDTADMYGTHQMLADALFGGTREHIFLQTKTMATDATGVRSDVERFHRELKTDYFDSLLLHCVEGGDWPMRLADAISELEKVKQSGSARLIGVSIHGMPALLAACSLAANANWLDLCMVRMNITGDSMDSDPSLVADCLRWLKHQGKILVGMKIFGNGVYDEERRRESLLKVSTLDLFSALVLGLTSAGQIDEIITST